ncbi:hypothetical protein DXG01_011322 [Tephrocybe rancida]|nr:hypothetical protein DXG01_011322 [Tephrocybe rancida]
MKVLPGGDLLRAGNEKYVAWYRKMVEEGQPEILKISELPDWWPEQVLDDGRLPDSSLWEYEEWQKLREQKTHP